MTDAFTSLLQVDGTLVRKWGRALVAIQDYSEPVPPTFFSEAGLPILPPTAKQLGFITTDGLVQAKSISATDTTMMQNLQPVRSDLESVTKALTCSFGEGSNAYVQGVYHGQPVANFPTAPDGPFVFDGGDLVEYPDYRLFLIAADGTGPTARYRVEYGYKVKVTSVTDRALARSNPETIGFTFGIFFDTAANNDLTLSENGPGLV